jgi:hypothetical protein
MSIATNLAKLGLGVNAAGIIAVEKGGTGTTTGGGGGGGSSGPKITAITVTDSSYANLDDTAVDVAGGYIKITGSGFETGCQVLVGTTPATSVTFISSTEVRAQVPATTAGTYIVYLVNSDGGVAIRVNGISFSATPTWTTASPLTGVVNSAISIQLTAAGATTFSLASGSTLPSGVSLSAAGLLTGTVTGITGSTTYNFTVLATDAELQDSPKTFAFDISVGDPYFMYNSLLLSANGTNGTQNNTFLDSSTNNFAITRAGNTTQGTFTPYGGNWSTFFGSANYISAPSNAAFGFGTGDFTVEAWVFPNQAYTTYNYIWATGVTNGLVFYVLGGVLYVRNYGNADILASSTAPALNTWTHVAATRSGTTLRIFVNGVQTGTTTNSTNFATGSGIVGNDGTNAAPWLGYISNMRVVKGTAVYTSNFTPSTTPLTAISGTSILTCQSNRFIDNSSNALTVTTSGSPTIQRFSPFSPGATYSSSTIGGSGYFDGNGDYLTAANNSAFNLNGVSFTVECWVYWNSVSGEQNIVEQFSPPSGPGWTFYKYAPGTPPAGTIDFYGGGSSINSGVTPVAGQWYHLAVSRNNSTGTTSFYVNGTRTATATFGVASSASTALVVGVRAGGSTYINGYIEDVRIVRGSYVYDPTATTITVPTTPVSAVANTQLLLGFTNAGIIDNTMLNNLETVGNARISTAQSKFGGSSMYFDGASYLSLPSSDVRKFGTGNFTFEFWIYTPSNIPSFTKLVTGGSSSTFTIETQGTTNVLWVTTFDATLLQSTVALTNSTWTHFAAVRNSGTLTIYINGVASGSTSNSTDFGSYLYIGGRPSTQYFTGYMDDIRATKGYARYTSNFTPPATALQTQ